MALLLADSWPAAALRLAEFRLAAAVVLAAALAAGALLRQPARRLAIAWGALAAVTLGGVMVAIPGRALVHLPGPASPSRPAEARTADRQARPNSLFTIEASRSATPAPVEAAAPALRLPPMASIAIGVAALGALVAAAWLVGGWLAARRLFAAGRPAEERVLRLLAEITKPAAPPRLLVSERLPVAVAVGLLRPTIVLPRHAVDRSNREDLRLMLAHEWAHVRAGDLWLLAALRVALVVLWPNPLYWLLRRRVRLDQERLADAAAADLAGREAYAERLVDWARDLTRRPVLVGAAGLWENASQLRRRVATLLDARLTVARTASLRWRAAATLGALSLAAVVSLVSLSPADPPADENAPEATDGAEVTVTGVFFAPAGAESFPVTGPSEPGVVEGTCYDEAGAALAGVEVRLYRGDPLTGDSELIESKTTGPAGGFRFAGVPDNVPRVETEDQFGSVDALYVVYARREGLATQSTANTPSQIAKEGLAARFTMRPAVALRGRVVDPSGAPVAGARVRISSMGAFDVGAPDLFSAITDADGRYVVDDLRPRDLVAERRRQEAERKAARGEFMLYVEDTTATVTHPDFAIAKAPLDQIPGERDVTMRPAAVIEGRVVDDDGAPVAGVVVSAQSAQQTLAAPADTADDGDDWTPLPSDFLHAVRRTDAAGKYRFDTFPAGTYHLRLQLPSSPDRLPDRIAAGMATVKAEAGETPNRAPDLLATTGRVVTVQFIDEATGEAPDFESPMIASVYFVPEGKQSGAYSQATATPDGRMQCRVTSGVGELGVAQLFKRDSWASHSLWKHDGQVAVGADQDAVRFPLERGEVSVGMKIELAQQAAREGDFDNAIAQIDEAIAQTQEPYADSPDHANLLYHRAMILGRAGREAEAIAAYEACLEAPPRFAFLIRNNLAHLLATAKDASLRDSERAVEVATEAVATAERPMAQFYDTLAEAHAAAGDFGPAAEAQQKAVNLALGPERAGFAAKLEAYQASRLPNAAP